MMRKSWIVSSLAAASLFVSGSVVAQTIGGTSHDLAGDIAGNGDDGRVCVYCHTPHGGNQDVAPLWNHEVTVATFDMYDSPTMDASGPGEPAGVSLACLSCHDGTVALDALIVPSDMTSSGTALMTGGSMVGTDLTNDHPISITYTGGGEFVATPTSPLFDSVVGGTPYSNQVECGSCHSVHDATNGNFLRMANTNSALCYDCHIK